MPLASMTTGAAATSRSARKYSGAAARNNTTPTKNTRRPSRSRPRRARKVIEMLQELTDDIIRRYDEDSDELRILIPQIEWLLNYAVDNRLE